MKKRKKSKWPTVLICFFTLLSTALSFMIRIYDRKQIMRCIETDEGIKTLLVSEKETKIQENP